MSKCVRSDCLNSGNNRCSICLKELYCSSACQRGDWKSHKLICKTLKKLSYQLQPYHEVVAIIKEILIEIPAENHLGVRVLLHLLSYAKHQFGDRISDKDYRERQNGERIQNLEVEIKNFIPIYSDLAFLYGKDKSLNMAARDDLVFPIFEKVLDLLRPWSIYLDSADPIDNLSKRQINNIWLLSIQSEQNIAMIYQNRNEVNEAENHCQRALTCARLYEGEEEDKIDFLCGTLKQFSMLHLNLKDFAKALPFAEEAYNCLAVAYNPVHPKVQEASSMLIECLILKGDFDHAETFAQLTLDSLKDPANKLDQLSEAVAKGYFNLGNAISHREVDIVKAENLLRESLRIRTLVHGLDHFYVGQSVSSLALILTSQEKLGDETREFYERALAINIKYCGPDGLNTVRSTTNLGHYYHNLANIQESIETRNELLRLSRIKFIEVLRIYTKIFGPDDPKTIDTSHNISIISNDLIKVT